MSHHDALVAILILAGAIMMINVRQQSPRRRRHSLRYELYLRSPVWRARRRVWIARAGWRCERCGRRTRPLTIHHRTYRRLGHEHRADVQVLCWSCHLGRHR